MSARTAQPPMCPDSSEPHLRCVLQEMGTGLGLSQNCPFCPKSRSQGCSSEELCWCPAKCLPDGRSSGCHPRLTPFVSFLLLPTLAVAPALGSSSSSACSTWTGIWSFWWASMGREGCRLLFSALCWAGSLSSSSRRAKPWLLGAYSHLAPCCLSLQSGPPPACNASHLISSQHHTPPHSLFSITQREISQSPIQPCLKPI